MIVIGTAGHIDHGKSSIVKRLTGTDPDRLPEEKARGMTIDLGFAFYHTDAGETIALVDVPGHERFVKNMIAGAGGIDAVMLVVAADDGWMPQSQEHYQIVKLLGVKHGFIALNKCDLAEPDWLTMLEQEIRTRVADSFLKDAPIFRISATTGVGFDSLAQYLNSLPAQIASKKDIGKARLYVDRSFVRPGIGGVVTGTLRGGTLSVGQPVSVWPSMAQGKVRSLQSHNEDVEHVSPGHRTAVAVTGVDKDLLVRGGVVSDRLDLSYFREHPVLALSMQMLQEAAVPLEDRRRALLIVGTTEAEGEIRLFEEDMLAAGRSGVAFFRPDEPIYALVGDRFILRLPTPTVTLGGGMLLDHLESFPRRKQLSALKYLRSRLSGRTEDLVRSELEKVVLASSDDLLMNADISSREVSDILVKLSAEKIVGRFQNWWYSTEVLGQASDSFKQGVTGYLKENPHLKGLSYEQILEHSGLAPDRTKVLVEYLIASGELTKLGDKYNLAGRGMSLKGVIKEAHDKIIAQLKAEPYAPPTLQSLAAQGKPYQEAIKFILESGEGYKCGSEFVLLMEVWYEVVRFIRESLDKSGQLAVTELRDRFGFSRKYAIPIVEETDRIKLTQRQGDIRIKGERFDNEAFIL